VSGLAAALVVAWVLGFAGVTWQWRRAESFRRRAEEGLAVARLRHRQAARALDQEHNTIAALLTFVGQRLDDGLGSRGDREALRDLVLRQYGPSLQQLHADPAFQRHLAGIALALAQLAELTAPPPEAFEAYRKAEGYYAALVRADARDWGARACLARCVGLQGSILLTMGRDVRARERLKEALVHWDEFFRLAGREGPDPASLRSAREGRHAIEKWLAKLEQRSGHQADADAAAGRAREIAREILRELESQPAERIRFAWWASELATWVRDDRPDEARSLLQRACEIYDSATPADLLNLQVARRAATSHFRLAGLDRRAGRATEAARGFEKAAALFERLSVRDPADSTPLGYLAVSYHVIGRLHVEGGRPVQALGPYRKATAIREQFARSHPDDPRTLSDCAGSWHRLGEALVLLGQRPEGAEAYRRSLAYLRRLPPEDLARGEHRRAWDERSRELFRLALGLGRLDEAIGLARERMARRPDGLRVCQCVAAGLASAVTMAGGGRPALARAVRDHFRRFVPRPFRTYWRAWCLSVCGPE
jgi:tetratricopeptide (TPR) repeat protein